MELRRVLVLLSALAACLPATAGDRVGEVSFLDGEVSVVRAGEALADELVQIGLAMENYDLVRTGTDGSCEIQASSGPAAGLSVRVGPRTQFSLEFSRTGVRQQASVNLIAGMLSMKCAKLAAGEEVKVRTDSTIMGVRGTRFTVVVPASGDLLVTCDEGTVDCTDENGDQQSALPGAAIEKRSGERLRGIPVAVTRLDQFQRDWLTERIASLKTNALKATAAFAKLYDELSRQFATDFATLLKAQRVLDKWADEDRRGKIGSTIEVLKEKREIIGALFRLRRTLFRFERVYARLLELKDYFDEGFGRGDLAPGLSAAQFFQRLDRERAELEQKMAKVRYVAKLYALRNEGRVPTGAFDDSEDESSFLGN